MRGIVLQDLGPFCLPAFPGKRGGAVLRRRRGKHVIVANATPEQVNQWLQTSNIEIKVNLVRETDKCMVVRVTEVYIYGRENKVKESANGKVIIELLRIRYLFPKQFDEVVEGEVQKFLNDRYERIVIRRGKVALREVKEYTILRYEAELIKLKQIFDTLKETYQCPFCGYIGNDIKNRRVKVTITWNAGDEDYYEPAHRFGYIDFCECPRCRKSPPNDVDVREEKSFARRRLVIATTEFMEQLQKVKELLSDELRWVSETSYKGVSMFDLPERIRKLVAIARDLVKDPSFILATPEEVEKHAQ